MVKIISDLAEFEKETKRPTLVVVDYYADWCGPCKMIAPFVESLATKYPGVTFLKVDVDAAEEISRSQSIQSMPTFQFFLGGNVVDEMKGADPEGLERRVIQHNVTPKEPSEMSIKELKAAIVHAGLASKCIGLSEKQEFVAVLKEYYSSLR